MKHYHLFIRLLSYTTVGSGKGSVYVDQEFLTDTQGLPYINGDRIKGLLKESLREYLEMNAATNAEEIIDKIFGATQTPDSRGNLQISHAKPRDYEKLLQDIQGLNLNAIEVSHLTGTVLYRTRINENGIAKNKTLRNIRAINPGWEFQANVTLANESDSEYLLNAVAGFQAMGSRRNRGKGAVLAWLEETQQDSVAAKEGQPPIFPEPANAEGLYELSYTLTLLDPVIATTGGTDINTIHSLEYIPGNMVWGAIAAADPSLITPELFNNPQVRFLSAFPTKDGQRAFSSSLSWQWNKDAPEKNRPLHDMLAGPPDEDANYKSAPSRWLEPTDTETLREVTVSMRRSFHTSRQDHRASGRSEDGEIFYKVQLAEGQQFKGLIQAPYAEMKGILERIGKKKVFNFGKSKYGENGRVSIALDGLRELSWKAEEGAKSGGTEICIYFRTPALFLNKYNYPEVNADAIASYIQTQLGLQVAPNIQENYLRPVMLEHFSGVKGGKTGMWPAVAMGSAILMVCSEPISENQLRKLEQNGLGEWTHRGYGEISAIFRNKVKKQPIIDRANGATPTSQAVNQPYSPQTPMGEKAQQNHLLQTARNKALDDLENYKNHLRNFSRTALGNFILLFRNVRDGNELQNALNHFKNLEAAKKLDKRFIQEMYSDVIGEYFEAHRTYWLTLLQLRQKEMQQEAKKKEGSNKS